MNRPFEKKLPDAFRISGFLYPALQGSRIHIAPVSYHYSTIQWRGMMTGGGSFGKKAALTIIRPFISLWVVIWFWPSRWVMHNRFLFRLKNPRLKPALLSLPFVYASLAYLLVINEFRRHFTQYALQRYVVFIRKHYSIGGLGYLHTENMNEAQRVALFSGEVGRIRYFLDHN